ncbi:hypothetical protein [Picrophilus oshimae]|uniref:Transcriptional regulator n=1 Tax=Picrophilus torridus (strain ATCC 700027 / DSM 9790 / JCM 10055 / NBRC 100828 / KAW 2/3) TaxID=1122961 RepID=Q6L0Y4_PICTO|nr:hypothetical protein [Picrophilus oshimae]AAT43368.1 conserved hypothetical protein [Picrophilus oshimae DSM 9789]
MDLKSIILRALRSRKYTGMAQYEIEILYNFSRSHISEVLSSMESENIIIRTGDGRLIKRVWLRDYYPGHIDKFIRIGILRSSEYIPLISGIYSMFNDYNIKIIPFDDTVSLMDALKYEALEFAMAPSLSQIMYAMTSDNIKIIGAVASGGSSIIKNSNDDKRLLSSALSSMMIMSREFARGKNLEIEFFKNPLRAVKEFKNSGYISIWEPYSTFLINNGYKKVSSYEDYLDSMPCCMVASNPDFIARNPGVLRIKNGDYNNDILKMFYKITGIGIKNIKESLKNYDFKTDISMETVYGIIEKTGILMDKNKIKNVFYLNK